MRGPDTREEARLLVTTRATNPEVTETRARTRTDLLTGTHVEIAQIPPGIFATMDFQITQTAPPPHRTVDDADADVISLSLESFTWEDNPFEIHEQDIAYDTDETVPPLC
jgi:hypothetical protein